MKTLRPPVRQWIYVLTLRPPVRQWIYVLTQRLLGFALFLASLTFPTITSAEAADSGAEPVVLCAWALANVGAPGTFEYGPAEGGTKPSPTAALPCTLTPAPATVVGQPATELLPATTGMLHVSQRGDQKRTLELWAAVSHPTRDAFGEGDGTVSWTVQDAATNSLTSVQPIGRSCGGVDRPGPMWAAASSASGGTGVFAPESIINSSGSGLWQACRQGMIRMFYGQFDLPTDACGAYSITTSATADGKTKTLAYGLEVLCPTDAVLDTVDIHWVVSPGDSSVVEGDLDPTTRDLPTITNNGKQPVQIGVVFTSLRQGDGPDTRAEFGISVSDTNGETTGIARLLGNENAWIPDAPAILCPGESVAANLLIDVPADLAPGEYSGSLRVKAKAVEQC